MSVTDSRCSVRKFTQSQFRSRTYDVPLCDCYPVISNTLHTTRSDHIRGLDPASNDDSGSDDDVALPMTGGSSTPSHTPSGTGTSDAPFKAPGRMQQVPKQVPRVVQFDPAHGEERA